MNYTLPITQARANLPTLVEEANVRETYITVKGETKAAIVDASWYQRLKETLDVLDDQPTMKRISQGLEDIEDGKLVPWGQVKQELSR